MKCREGVVFLAATVLGGCAGVPDRPTPSPSNSTVTEGAATPSTVRAAPAPRSATAITAAAAGTIDAWRARAQQHRAKGDLANAAIAWHVLTLLDADEPAYRQELANTQAAIRREVRTELDAGKTALQKGDGDRALMAFLRVLAVEPRNTEAARALRDLDKRKLVRSQDDRATRARAEDPKAGLRGGRASPVDSSAAYDLEQGLAMFTAGDTAGGLRELSSWVEQNPRDRVGRQRGAAAVFNRGQELEAQGAGEQALALYDAAIALRGEAAAGWSPRAQSLRKKLSGDYYDRATRTERTDLGAAITALEASLRFDPGNSRAATKLAQLRVAQSKLRALDRSPPK
ncbi:MAG: hypothetical protein ABIS17_01460 [Casimicrobiaceae bacterium]